MEQPDQSPQDTPAILSSSVSRTAQDEDDFDLRLPGHVERRFGRIPENLRVQVAPFTRSGFRRIKDGVLEATEEVALPKGPLARLLYQTKRLLIGAPIATAQSEQERLTKFKALAVLSSDAISSVAYATEAILINLVAAGSGHLGLTWPISLAIVGLLCIVALSYRQTIPAYPNGGGSYIVAKENLGTLPGLIAAAALMIDYILIWPRTVSLGVQLN